MTGLSERCGGLTLPLGLLRLADEFFTGAGERPVLCPLLLDLLGLLRGHDKPHCTNPKASANPIAIADRTSSSFSGVMPPSRASAQAAQTCGRFRVYQSLTNARNAQAYSGRTATEWEQLRARCVARIECLHWFSCGTSDVVFSKGLTHATQQISAALCNRGV